ncbi:MAG: hypothetical protein KDD19_12425 [Phaeodactylibacter sp.]|nr:hypothetical protein [Phaeodactylibacter sp.]MCB9051569.1 hypothetical protein [Lewinellaceae bacterium]
MIKQVGKLKVDKFSSPSPQPPQNGKPIGVLLVLVALTLFVLMGQKDFIIWKDGGPELAPWRKAKLEKELEEIDNAEQYAFCIAARQYAPRRKYSEAVSFMFLEFIMRLFFRQAKLFFSLVAGVTGLKKAAA